jgi:hypothetical protein
MTSVQPAHRPLPPREQAHRGQGQPSTEAPPFAGRPALTLPPGASQPGPRIQRLRQRRRLVREELAVIVILVIALVATLVILAFQWLGSGTSTSAVGIPRAVSHLIGGSL